MDGWPGTVSAPAAGSGAGEGNERAAGPTGPRLEGLLVGAAIAAASHLAMGTVLPAHADAAPEIRRSRVYWLLVRELICCSASVLGDSGAWSWRRAGV